jgi:hypothetical protein
MKARFAKEVGTRVSLRRYWGDAECPNCLGGGNRGYHNATKHLFDTPELLNGVDSEGNMTYNRFGGEPEDYTEWPTKCDHCDAIAPEETKRQVFNKRLYNTPSGDLEPGCLYYAPWYDDVYWDNQSTPSLCAICPNGGHWVIDGRASNCTMPEDKTHRCWVRHGDPENGTIHVDKNGHTCAAGGGSIISGDYHGFLHNGEFTKA